MLTSRCVSWHLRARAEGATRADERQRGGAPLTRARAGDASSGRGGHDAEASVGRRDTGTRGARASERREERAGAGSGGTLRRAHGVAPSAFFFGTPSWMYLLCTDHSGASLYAAQAAHPAAPLLPGVGVGGCVARGRASWTSRGSILREDDGTSGAATANWRAHGDRGPRRNRSDGDDIARGENAPYVIARVGATTTLGACVFVFRPTGRTLLSTETSTETRASATSGAQGQNQVSNATHRSTPERHSDRNRLSTKNPVGEQIR